MVSTNGLPVSYSLLLAEKRAPNSELSAGTGSDASTRAATGAPDEAEKPSQTSASTRSGDANDSANGGSDSNGSCSGGKREEGRKVAAELAVEQERDKGELREVYAGAGQSFTAEGLRPYTTYCRRAA